RSRLPEPDYCDSTLLGRTGRPRARHTMIQTKVARIISPTQVVLAAGSNDDVKEGMEFVIYQLTQDILNPETNESLGTLELVKGRVQVVHAQEKISIAQTIPKTIAWGGITIAAALAPQTETVFPKLPVDEAEIDPPTDLKVRVGDLAHSVET